VWSNAERPGRRCQTDKKGNKDGGGATTGRADVQVTELGGSMSSTTTVGAPVRAARPWYKILYVQVLFAIALGVVVGWLAPQLATNDWIKALGTASSS